MQRFIGRWLPLQSIGARLGWLQRVFLLLILLLGVFSIARFSQISSALKTSVIDQTASQERVRAISINCEVAARKLLVLIGAPREQRVAAYTRIDEANQHLDILVGALHSQVSDAEVRAAFKALQTRLLAYRARYAEAVDLIEAEDVAGARALLSGPAEAALSGLDRALNDYARAEGQAAARRVSALEGVVQRDVVVALSGCALAVVLGALLTSAITRSIVRPLNATSRGARRIAAGEYEHRVPIESVDEVGKLGIALNQLAQDVAEREAARVHAAETEGLTNLPRRRRFVRLVAQMIESGLEPQGLAIMICIDIDRLKSINALLGFEAGDALVAELAERIRGSLRQRGGPNALGRLSGGSFVAFVPLEHMSRSDADVAAIQADLEHRFDWEGHSLDVAATIGYALYPADGTGNAGVDLLLRRSEMALYEAKRIKARARRFDPTWELVRAGHLSMLSALKAAARCGEFRQMLQPKVCARTGAFLGAEALIRWQHPVRGFMSPADFIPFAERSGQIREITRWMLGRAIHNLATLPGLKQGQGYIGVNISTLDLLDADLPCWIGECLRRCGVEARRLQLEVTESGLMASGQGPVEILLALRAVGVSIALDDFGTGQSSLAYLQRLPVNELKIDRSFVERVEQDARRQLLLRSVVELGHGLGLTVTAEGVETDAEAEILCNAGVDVMQGYRISRPLEEAGLAAFAAPRAPVDARPALPWCERA